MINVLAKKTELLGRIQRTPWVAISASFLAGAVFMGAAASDRAPAVMAFEASKTAVSATAVTGVSQPVDSANLLHLTSGNAASGAFAGTADVSKTLEGFKKPGASDSVLPKVTAVGRGVNLASVKASRAPTLAKAEDELFCLAQNIYFEARSEPTAGRRAVAHVVMNRVASSRFPSTVCEVVRQGGEDRLHRCQFSWWCDGQSDDITNAKSWQDAERLASFVYWGLSIDMTGGALFYHADYVAPRWRTAFNKGPTIGRHIFYSYKKPTKKVKGTQLASRAADQE